MSLTLAAIKLLRDKGLTLDDVIEVAEACQDAPRSKGAERQARYRERKNASDVTSDVTSDASPPRSLEQNVPTPLKTQTLPKENPPRGGQKKGTRLDPDWQPSESLIAYAAEHGVTGPWLHREVERFRNFWHGKSGRDAAKADWDATWRNWVLKASENGPPKGCEPAVRTALANGQAAGGYYAKQETPQFEAWREHELRIKGKPPPTDRNGGWLFPSEFPPQVQMQAAE